MNVKQFHQRMRAKFPFSKDGWLKLRSAERLVFVDGRGRPVELGPALLNIDLEGDKHFEATAIMAAPPGGNEIVHIGESGRYFDHVYWSDHVELYTLEYLDDLEALARALARAKLAPAKYARLTPEKRIAAMPFFRHPLAKSLDAFFAGIRTMPADEFYSIVDPTPTPARAAKPKRLARLEYKDKTSNKFWEAYVSGSTLTVHFGRIGTEGRRTSKELASNDAALEAAKKLIEEKRKKGYVRRR